MCPAPPPYPCSCARGAAAAGWLGLGRQPRLRRHSGGVLLCLLLDLLWCIRLHRVFQFNITKAVLLGSLQETHIIISTQHRHLPLPPRCLHCSGTTPSSSTPSASTMPPRCSGEPAVDSAGAAEHSLCLVLVAPCCRLNKARRAYACAHGLDTAAHPTSLQTAPVAGRAWPPLPARLPWRRLRWSPACWMPPLPSRQRPWLLLQWAAQRAQRWRLPACMAQHQAAASRRRASHASRWASWTRTAARAACCGRAEALSVSGTAGVPRLAAAGQQHAAGSISSSGCSLGAAWRCQAGWRVTG